MWNAVSNANLPLVRSLLDSGENPNALHQGMSYLQIAAQNSLYHRVSDVFGFENPYIPVMDLLVHYGADPTLKNSLGLTPYEHYNQNILLYPSPEIKRILDPSPLQHTTLQRLLRFAVCSGRPYRIKTLIKMGADPTELSYGKTLRSLAIRNSKVYNRDWNSVLEILNQYEPRQT
jgi:ankyrin repeat protein